MSVILNLHPVRRYVVASLSAFALLTQICAAATTAPRLYPLRNQPDHIAQAADGSMWFTEPGIDEVGRLTPSGAISSYEVTRGSYPEYITAGPDGNVWFTERNQHVVAKITPDGAVTEFPVATAGSTFTGIVSAPDGNLWVSDRKSKIYKVSPAGMVTDYAVGKNAILGLSFGAAGSLWFTEENLNYKERRFGRMTLDGKFREFVVHSRDGGQLNAITLGPDGNMWVSEFAAGGFRAGRITPSGGLTEFSLPSFKEDSAFSGDADSIVATRDAVWFAYGTHHLAKISAAGSVAVESTRSRVAGPRGLFASAEGVWFAEPGINSIGERLADGMQRDYALPPGKRLVTLCAGTAESLVIQFSTKELLSIGFFAQYSIAVAPDGDVWFADNSRRLAVFSPLTRKVRRFATEPVDSLLALRDGSIWFTVGNKIGTVLRGGTIGEFPVSPVRIRVVLKHIGSRAVEGVIPPGPGALARTAGDDLWFVYDDSAFRVNRRGKVLAKQFLGADVQADGAAFDKQDRLWFTQLRGGAVVMISRGQTVTRNLGPQAMPTNPVIDSNGTPWVLTDALVKLSDQGIPTAYPVRTSEEDHPGFMIAGKDGTMWFDKPNTGIIGKLMPDAACVEYSLPRWDSAPTAMAQAPDGSIWFLESAVQRLGRITPEGRIAEYALGDGR